jgi:hypothetical protein
MYALKLYGIGPFPKFIDNLRDMRTVKKWLAMAKSDGYREADIFKDAPKKPGYFGIERQLVRTEVLK